MSEEKKEKTSKEKRLSGWKENALDLAIAAGPAGIVITLLKQVGVSGLIPSLLLVLAPAFISRKIRENKGIRVSGNLILKWILIDLGILFVVPVALLIILNLWNL